MLGLRAKLAPTNLRNKYGRLGNPKEKSVNPEGPCAHGPDTSRVVQTAVKQAAAAEVRAGGLTCPSQDYHRGALTPVAVQDAAGELLQALEQAQLAVSCCPVSKRNCCRSPVPLGCNKLVFVQGQGSAKALWAKVGITKVYDVLVQVLSSPQPGFLSTLLARQASSCAVEACT